jgi:hypothetical protein
MYCSHTGYHGIRTIYDRRRSVLIYEWTCECCGKPLGEARRVSYRPAFDPRGNERFMRQGVLAE